MHTAQGKEGECAQEWLVFTSPVLPQRSRPRPPYYDTLCSALVISLIDSLFMSDDLSSVRWRLPFAVTWSLTGLSALWFAYVTLYERGYFRGDTRHPSSSPPPVSSAPETLLSTSEFRPFTLRAAEQVTPNVKCLTFDLPPGRSLDLPIGRHLQVRVMHDGQPAMAYYTPVSINAAKGFFCLVVKRYEDGKVSTKIHELKPGDALDGARRLSLVGVSYLCAVRGPTGRFLYAANQYESVGMLAGGTGITPMLQLLKSSAADASDSTNMRLIFSNSTDKDIILGPCCTVGAATHFTTQRTSLTSSRRRHASMCITPAAAPRPSGRRAPWVASQRSSYRHTLPRRPPRHSCSSVVRLGSCRR